VTMIMERVRRPWVASTSRLSSRASSFSRFMGAEFGETMVTGAEPRAPRRMSQILFCGFTGVVSYVVLLLTFFHPSDGLGVTVCWFNGLTRGLPCPGCGLSRSLSCISHLQFGRSFSYHPFGFVFYVLFVSASLYWLFPKRVKASIVRWADDRNRVFLRFYKAFVTAFLAFGVARTLVAVAVTMG